MAIRQIGLTARLSFSGGSAIAGMRRVSAAFKNVQAQAKLVRQGIGNIKTGINQMAKFGAMSAVGTGLALSRYTEFTGAMSKVSSVLMVSDKKNAKYIGALTAKAQSLGASTIFTATQAAQGMESLARAGFKPKEVLKSIGSVLSVAAAEGMSLSTAADIVAANIRAFGLDAEDAAMVTDVLAFVSANTNTNITDLQEGMKYAAPVAKTLGIKFEDTAAAMGIMADSGLKGSVGGTALKNAMIKLAKAAKNGTIQIGDQTVKIAKNKKGQIQLGKTLFNVAGALRNIKDPMKRTNAGMKLFGIRGFNAAAAFAVLNPNSAKAKLLFGDLAANAKGAAKNMADIQISSLAGKFKLLTSGVDGLLMAFAKTFEGGLAKSLDVAIKILNDAAKVFDHFAKKPEDFNATAVPAIQGVSKTIVELVRGVLKGLDDSKKAFNSVIETIQSVSNKFGFLKDKSVEDIARLVTKIATIGAALTTVGLGIAALNVAFGGFVKIGVGAAKTVAGAFGLLGTGLKGVAKGGKAVGKAFFSAISLMTKGIFSAIAGLTKFTLKLAKSAVRAIGAFILAIGKGALAVGKFGLSMAVTGVKRVGAFTLSLLKLSGKMALAIGKFGLVAGAVALVATTFFKFGRWLDNRFNLSKKVANKLSALEERITGRRAKAAKATQKRLRMGRVTDEIANIVRVFRMQRKAGKGGMIKFRGEPFRRRITKELLIERVERVLKKEGLPDLKGITAKSKITGPEGTKALDLLIQIRNALHQLPKAEDWRAKLQVDGRKLGEVNRRYSIDTTNRGGTSDNRRSAR